MRGKKNRRKNVAAALTPAGRVAPVGSNTRGSDLRRVRVGDPVSRLPGPHDQGEYGPAGDGGPKARFVYGVRHGRVRFVAVATRAASKNRTVLRGYLKRAEFL